MPANGLFDKVTEIFFGNSNEGGVYQQESVSGKNSDGTISLTKASRNGFSISGISNVIHGRKPNHKGYRWLLND